MKSVAAAIEFGTSKIITLLAESGNFTRCEIVGSGTVPYDGYMDGDWNDREGLFAAVQEAVRAAEVESKRRIRDVFVGVPCEYIRVLTSFAEVEVLSEDGRVTEADIDAVMDAAADKLNLPAQGGNVIHRSPAWFSLNGGKHINRPVGEKAATLQAQISFVLADSVFIQDMRAILGAMGITINAFLSPSLGTGMLLLSYEEREKRPILVDVGYLNTEVSVMDNDAIIYHAVLPLGGGHITAALAEALEIGMQEAEIIKRDFIFTPDEFDPQSDTEVRFPDGSTVTFPREFVEQTVMEVVEDLMDMLEQTLEDAQECLTARSQLYLTGGGLVNMRGSKEYLAEKLHRSVKIPVVRATRLNNPRFSASLGLIDLVFDSLEGQAAPAAQEGGINRLASLKNIFRRNTQE